MGPQESNKITPHNRQIRDHNITQHEHMFKHEKTRKWDHNKSKS